MATTADTLSAPAHEDPVEALRAYHAARVEGCTACALSATRTTVVPGSGDPRARLMFVGEAPGYHEDRRGVPFCGAAGNLLDEMLAGIGLTRDEVFVANVLKCRPPGNRDPLPAEIAACEPHLFRQVRIIRPAMICSLGNFATKLLSGRADGISRVHGCELAITVAGVDVLLYPVYHPAAALYTPAMRATLEADFARIPDLLGGILTRPGDRPGTTAPASPATVPAATPVTATAPEPTGAQLGLF